MLLYAFHWFTNYFDFFWYIYAFFDAAYFHCLYATLIRAFYCFRRYVIDYFLRIDCRDSCFRRFIFFAPLPLSFDFHYALSLLSDWCWCRFDDCWCFRFLFMLMPLLMMLPLLTLSPFHFRFRRWCHWYWLWCHFMRWLLFSPFSPLLILRHDAIYIPIFFDAMIDFRFLIFSYFADAAFHWCVAFAWYYFCHYALMLISFSAITPCHFLSISMLFIAAFFFAAGFSIDAYAAYYSILCYVSTYIIADDFCFHMIFFITFWWLIFAIFAALIYLPLMLRWCRFRFLSIPPHYAAAADFATLIFRHCLFAPPPLSLSFIHSLLIDAALCWLHLYFIFSDYLRWFLMLLFAFWWYWLLMLSPMPLLYVDMLIDAAALLMPVDDYWCLFDWCFRLFSDAPFSFSPPFSSIYFFISYCLPLSLRLFSLRYFLLRRRCCQPFFAALCCFRHWCDFRLMPPYDTILPPALRFSPWLPMRRHIHMRRRHYIIDAIISMLLFCCRLRFWLAPCRCFHASLSRDIFAPLRYRRWLIIFHFLLMPSSSIYTPFICCWFSASSPDYAIFTFDDVSLLLLITPCFSPFSFIFFISLSFLSLLSPRSDDDDADYLLISLMPPLPWLIICCFIFMLYFLFMLWWLWCWWYFLRWLPLPLSFFRCHVHWLLLRFRFHFRRFDAPYFRLFRWCHDIICWLRFLLMFLSDAFTLISFAISLASRFMPAPARLFLLPLSPLLQRFFAAITRFRLLFFDALMLLLMIRWFSWFSAFSFSLYFAAFSLFLSIISFFFHADWCRFSLSAFWCHAMLMLISLTPHAINPPCRRSDFSFGFRRLRHYFHAARYTLSRDARAEAMRATFDIDARLSAIISRRRHARVRKAQRDAMRVIDCRYYAMPRCLRKSVARLCWCAYLFCRCRRWCRATRYWCAAARWCCLMLHIVLIDDCCWCFAMLLDAALRATPYLRYATYWFSLFSSCHFMLMMFSPFSLSLFMALSPFRWWFLLSCIIDIWCCFFFHYWCWYCWLRHDDAAAFADAFDFHFYYFRWWRHADFSPFYFDIFFIDYYAFFLLLLLYCCCHVIRCHIFSRYHFFFFFFHRYIHMLPRFSTLFSLLTRHASAAFHTAMRCRYTRERFIDAAMSAFAMAYAGAA